MFNLPAPPGFQGLHPSRPVTFYERHLPHWRQDGATYFITFRLADSLPQQQLFELKSIRNIWLSRNPPPHTDAQREEVARIIWDRIERWLDQGMGGCELGEANCSAVVAQAMHHFDGERYELAAYVIMSNHVHAAVRPLLEHDLEEIVGGWKRHAARRINELQALSGSLWQDESFDRIIRDEEHLYRVIQYIGRNPMMAGLAVDGCPRWIRPQWAALGWVFEDRQ